MKQQPLAVMPPMFIIFSLLCYSSGSSRFSGLFLIGHFDSGQTHFFIQFSLGSLKNADLIRLLLFCGFILLLVKPVFGLLSQDPLICPAHLSTQLLLLLAWHRFHIPQCGIALVSSVVCLFRLCPHYTVLYVWVKRWLSSLRTTQLSPPGKMSSWGLLILFR